MIASDCLDRILEMLINFRAYPGFGAGRWEGDVMPEYFLRLVEGEGEGMNECFY